MRQDKPEEKVPDWKPMQMQRKAATVEDVPPQGIEIEDLSKKIYARSIKGNFNSFRLLFIGLTQFIFFILPWLNWNGRQAILFDILHRKFYIFGLVLWPQDVFYLAFILIVAAYALFLFTALAGRLFCGYSCPQTVYTEMFMWIERKVEGDRSKRMRFDKQPWTFSKIRTKATKILCWAVLAFWIGFSFIGWFTPIRQAFLDLIHFDLSTTEWFFILFYGFYAYMMAGILRDNVCRYMCPYARFQSVMIDADTLVVTYDKMRGEPRGARKKTANPKDLGLGDCIDCTMCVQVCPTGIDIRNGLQYMCIGCGACIDACNEVMDKMKYPRGLIRYTSENGMLMGLSTYETQKRLWRPRIFVYIGLLIIFIAGIVTSLYLRNDIRMDIVRDRGSLGREVPGGFYENVYQVQLINMTEQDRQFAITADTTDLSSAQVSIESRGNQVKIAAFDNKWIPVVIRVPVKGAEVGRHEINIKINSNDDADDKPSLKINEDTSFFVPE
ncbi:cytochrome c oxidase accessory protein CcoG [Brackiella oedipodis]|uniref:cytochrome c oxidase accessory protein CcoG n=1 Tax=Brackiella oedipodis TaxID=124225 RepID=UPI00048B9611|nr:cytochrome c oxidase accessory protein CcoG [Brackiella oedipodis]